MVQVNRTERAVALKTPLRLFRVRVVSKRNLRVVALQRPLRLLVFYSGLGLGSRLVSEL